jgi:diacylglycerol kinase family enzyme
MSQLPDPAEIAIVANPVAGGYSHNALIRLADALDRLGRRCSIRLTRYPGELTEIAAALPASVTTLVVGGGDGSINEAVAGLVVRENDMPVPALAILPFGTANVLAHEIGVSFRPERLAERIAGGARRPLHLGRIGDWPFVLMVSAGFDAEVVHAVDSRVKKRWGKLAYAAAALRLALAREDRMVTVEADGETVTCRLAVVTTASRYGGPYVLTRGTDVTRAGLRLVTLADGRPWTLLKAAIALGRGRLDRLAAVTDRPVVAVRFSGEDVSMQIDGDRMETTGAEIRAGRVVEVVA